MSEPKAPPSLGFVVIGWLIVLFGLFPLLLVYHGFVLQKMWSWYVVPLGPPELTLRCAIGLGLTFAFLRQTARSKDCRGTAAEILTVEFFGPAVTLAFGWVVQWWPW